MIELKVANQSDGAAIKQLFDCTVINIDTRFRYRSVALRWTRHCTYVRTGMCTMERLCGGWYGVYTWPHVRLACECMCACARIRDAAGENDKPLMQFTVYRIYKLARDSVYPSHFAIRDSNLLHIHEYGVIIHIKAYRHDLDHGLNYISISVSLSTNLNYTLLLSLCTSIVGAVFTWL